MKAFIFRLSKITFLRNLFALLTGNIIAQVITVISIPILTRVYTPEEFGAVALYIGIINLLAMASTGSYDTAIVLPKRQGQAFNLLVGSIGVVVIVSLLSVLGIVVCYGRLSDMFEAETYRRIIWFIPLLVFMFGSHKALYYWYNRNRRYRAMGLNLVVQNGTQVGVRLNRWIFSDGHWGMAGGFFAGLLMAWAALFVKVFRRESWRLRYLSFKSILKTFREYRNFPAFLLPMAVLNSFSVHLLIFTLSLITTGYWVGLYERA